MHVVTMQMSYTISTEERQKERAARRDHEINNETKLRERNSETKLRERNSETECREKGNNETERRERRSENYPLPSRLEFIRRPFPAGGQQGPGEAQGQIQDK